MRRIRTMASSALLVGALMMTSATGLAAAQQPLTQQPQQPTAAHALGSSVLGAYANMFSYAASKLAVPHKDAAAASASAAYDPQSSRYRPVRTAHPVIGSDEVGSRYTRVFGLAHPAYIQEHDDDSVGAQEAADSAEESSGRSSGSSSHQAHETLQFDKLRNAMKASWSTDTTQSSDRSMSFLRNFPRKKADGSAGTNQLQRLGGPFNRTAANAAEADPIGDYVAGMFFMYGVPLFFAMLAIVCWAGFCISRCACNLCGRHATVLYTDKQVRVIYALVACLVVIMGVCCAFGWTGNVQVSEGIDSGFVAADMIANYGYEFMGVASTAYAVGYDAMLLGISFNATLMSAPNAVQSNASLDCITTSGYNALQSQAAFVAALRPHTAYLGDHANYVKALADSSFGVGAVAAASADMATALPDPFPAGGASGNTMLQNLRAQLTTLRADFSNLPSAGQISAAITAINTLKGVDTTAASSTKLQALAAHWVTLHTQAAVAAPALIGSLKANFDQLEAANLAGVSTTLSNAVTLTGADGDPASESADIVTTYDSLLSTFSTDLPQDWTLFRSDLARLAVALAQANATLASIQAEMPLYTTSLSGWPGSGDGSYTALQGLSLLSSFQTTHGPALQSVLAVELPTLIQAIHRMRTGITAALDSFAVTTAQRNDIASNVDLDVMAAQISAFNQTAGTVACFVEVFSMLKAINTSVVVLPDAVSTVTLALDPLVVAQATALPSIYSNMLAALTELQTIATNQAAAQPDYPGLTTKLTALNTTLQSSMDFAGLFTEVQSVARALYDVTAAAGVTVTYSASPPTLWGDVASVSATVAPASTGGYSALLGMVTDFHATLHMTTALSNLQALTVALQAQLGSEGLSASFLESMDASLAGFQSAAATLPPLLQAAYTNPTTIALPFASSSLRDSIIAALGNFAAVISARPSPSRIDTGLGGAGAMGLPSSIGTPAAANLASIDSAVLGALASLVSLPRLPQTLADFMSNATTAATPLLTDCLAGSPNSQLETLQTALDPAVALAGVAAENTKVQSIGGSYGAPRTAAVLTALDAPGLVLTPTSRDALSDTVDRLSHLQQSFPDFNAKVMQSLDGLSAITSALEYMQVKKVAYQKTSSDFKATIDNYDGVRLLVFNLGVLLPFVLAFVLLLSACSHSSCPAMLVGLSFFPMFVLFMCMSAVQMPVSVALSDHCYNTTGELKIQMEGRTYPKEKVGFFQLSADIDVPNVVNYFAACVGEPPELLTKLYDPLALLAANQLESGALQAEAAANVGLPFAQPLVDDFAQLDKLQARVIKDVFNKAVEKLNCTRSSLIYSTAMSAICTDFGPPFALTTCVFLLAGICMIPGICLGIVGYKRFNPLNLDSAYSRAPTHEGDDGMMRGGGGRHMHDPSVPEGWN